MLQVETLVDLPNPFLIFSLFQVVSKDPWLPGIVEPDVLHFQFHELIVKAWHSHPQMQSSSMPAMVPTTSHNVPCESKGYEHLVRKSQLDKEH